MSSKNKTLFKTPFSKEYWRLAAAELKNPRVLVFAALMIALRIAMKNLSIPIGPDLRIGVAFFVNALGAMVFGPVVAMAAAAVSDTIAAILFPTGSYFFPFIIPEIAGSLIFALFLYRAEITPARTILSRFSISFFVNIVISTPVFMLFYHLMLGKTYDIFQIPRIVKNLVLFPIEGILLSLFLATVTPICTRHGFGYSTTDKLKLTKKSIVGTIALFITAAGLAIVYFLTLS